MRLLKTHSHTSERQGYEAEQGTSKKKKRWNRNPAVIVHELPPRLESGGSVELIRLEN